VLLKAVFQIVANTFTSWVDGRVGQDIRCDLAKSLNTVGYTFFLVEKPSRLFNILGTESWKASDAVRVLLGRIATTANIAMFSVFLLLVSWQLTLLVFVGGVLAQTIQSRMERRLRRLSKETVSSNQVLHNRMLSLIFGVRVIRLFNTQQLEMQRFETDSDEVRRTILRSERVSGTQWPLLESIHGLLIIITLLSAIFMGISLPVLATFLVLMNRLQPHLRNLEASSAAFAAASAHFQEVEWLLESSGKPQAPTGTLPFLGLRDHIVFEHVTHDYGTRNAPALGDASFVLRRGQATALVGESGSGKSTVINLLCRLLDPTAGRILVDGIPLTEIRVADWLDKIAIAGQDIDLIDGTVAENIAYGRSAVSHDEIVAALLASSADFVLELPLGIETPVGPGGISLSGGQRQRIGLARALARKPELLILDEATNALDSSTEGSILNVLQKLRGSLTMLIVSHKGSTLAFCDDALVLNMGKVVTTDPSAVMSRVDQAHSLPA
jgi:ABC-type multidrug transport system fused ATPase/permease subunit